MYITNMHTTPKNADCKLQTACVDISFNKPAAVTGQETDYMTPQTYSNNWIRFCRNLNCINFNQRASIFPQLYLSHNSQMALLYH